MKENIDIRAGYRVPDDYFQNFAIRMSEMAATSRRQRRRRAFRLIYSSVASIAAVLIMAIGLFQYVSIQEDPVRNLMTIPSEEFITAYLGATEDEVIENYFLQVEDSEDNSQDNGLNYVMNSGNVNLYALLDNF